MVIVVGNGCSDPSSNSGRVCISPLGKVCVQLFFIQLWLNSRVDLALNLGLASSLEGKPVKLA